MKINSSRIPQANEVHQGYETKRWIFLWEMDNLIKITKTGRGEIVP
jgi:hypothetical protein